MGKRTPQSPPPLIAIPPPDPALNSKKPPGEVVLGAVCDFEWVGDRPDIFACLTVPLGSMPIRSPPPPQETSNVGR